MTSPRPDYFASPPSKEEAALRRIKGNFRRRMVAGNIESGGLKSIPEGFLDHELSEFLKGFLQRQHPQARGGEDLPDLLEGEVEIARLSLANSVHGEVTSLRARKDDGAGNILYRMVDEYEAEIVLTSESSTNPLTVEEVLDYFSDADPSPANTSCEIKMSSDFYPGLNELAQSKWSGG